MALFLAGCQQQQASLSDAQKESITKEVKEQAVQMVAAVNQLNVEAWSKFYSEKGFISSVALADYYGDRKEWIDLITKHFSARERQHIDLTDVRVTPLAANLALMTSQGKAAIKLKDGKETNFKHVFTMVWKKDQEGWKILHSHESWTDAPAQTPVEKPLID
jgi:ketosteroid isomerase-like protein